MVDRSHGDENRKNTTDHHNKSEHRGMREKKLF
jgi:hypothetical protein